MTAFIENFKRDFIKCFITKNRWKYIVTGLGNTIKIALVAALMGVLLGAVVAVIRTSWDRNEKTMKPGAGRSVLAVLNWLCKLYTTIIRGTPVMIQIMIMFFVIFSSVRNGVPVAMLTFGINSGAYVSEIIRGGIMSVDIGQTEAGRALGLGYVQVMCQIVVPQALKSVLPSLCNEFIALLKETSVACYVAVTDLTKGGEIIRGITYVQAMPLFVVALLYLIMVIILTKLVGILERRLRNSER